MKINYRSNNSGGGWWLSDEDWIALEKAGWKVLWVKDGDPLYLGKDGRWLGGLAQEAYREGLSYDEAVSEFEQVTGQNVEDEGCECCGRPHNFYESK